MNATLRKLVSNKSVSVSIAMLALLTLLAIFAPWLGTADPQTMDYMNINAPAGQVGSAMSASGVEQKQTYWLGTDGFGRDIYSRLIYGTRVSLWVGLVCAIVAMLIGGTLGMLAGYFRLLDSVLMRVMDGLMAIPAILLAITLVAVLGPSLSTVVVAIAIPEVPRIARLVRSLVLSLREEPYVEAAKALATPTPVILVRHILPNAIAPLIVQATFIAAASILTEAVLSFLGLGLPPDIPTWGNVMAEGRIGFAQHPGHVLLPAMFLVPTVLAINLLGDGLRDILDPKLNRRII
jgi:peptide/nickel transport system permease protein